ncbi:MAG TPA: hypothetical protein VFV37_04640 [Luteibaculaceae bacterium]|nr:hypothetical protein [Luteibaculaceae bacterium]
MKKLQNLKAISLLVLAFGFIAVTYSCKKDEPTIVKITIVDPDGFSVKEATVRLYGRSSDPADSSNQANDIRFDQTQTTDASGQVSYDLSYLTKPGQAGFMVLDIDATKLDKRGVGIINVEEKKTNTKTVIIQ